MAWGVPIYELEESMSSSIFTEAMNYYSIEPFGSKRDNMHAGLIAATVANVNISKKRDKMSPDDFMLKTKREKELELEREEMQKINGLMDFFKGIAKNGG